MSRRRVVVELEAIEHDGLSAAARLLQVPTPALAREVLRAFVGLFPGGYGLPDAVPVRDVRKPVRTATPQPRSTRVVAMANGRDRRLARPDVSRCRHIAKAPDPRPAATPAPRQPDLAFERRLMDVRTWGAVEPRRREA